MTNLPKIFCLTLKDTPKRREYAEQHFKENGLDVEFFEGINGTTFGLRTTIPYKDDNTEGYDYFISSGHIGCILSHLMLWKTLQYLPYEEIIILEDDVILCNNFINKLNVYKSQLPNDWQYVFVGHCCLPPENYHIKVTENIITTTHPPMCTHAYMIKKSSLPLLLDTNHSAWAHIDIQIQKRSLKQLKHYVLMPPLAEQMSINQDDKSDFKSLTFDWEFFYKNQQV
jgi:GR25 family glycosyltransferase involved in LPS biosynthesis